MPHASTIISLHTVPLKPTVLLSSTIEIYRTPPSTVRPTVRPTVLLRLPYSPMSEHGRRSCRHLAHIVRHRERRQRRALRVQQRLQRVSLFNPIRCGESTIDLQKLS